jgi:hypothetical protein
MRTIFGGTGPIALIKRAKLVAKFRRQGWLDHATALLALATLEPGISGTPLCPQPSEGSGRTAQAPDS